MIFVKNPLKLTEISLTTELRPLQQPSLKYYLVLFNEHLSTCEGFCQYLQILKTLSLTFFN